MSNKSSTDADISLLRQSISHLDNVLSSLESLAKSKPWSKLGYFDATQHDNIEHLYFRFLVSRGVLVSLALPQGNNSTDNSLQNALEKAESSFSSDEEGTLTDNASHHTLRTKIILSSALALFVYEGRFIKCFLHDEVAINKLNQQFYRSDIQADTYNTLKLECTDSSNDGRLQSLASAYNMLYCNEEESIEVTTDSTIQTEALASLTDSLVKQTNELLQDLYVSKQNVAIKFKNKLQHAPIGNVARTAKRNTKALLTETRACTFKGVSRLKSPVAHLIRFSIEQKKEILASLQPGDLIFTYTAGYMSDVFIPGAFKHGITYVGSPEDREEAGLTADYVASIYDSLPAGEVETLLEHFKTSKVPSLMTGNTNLDANVIESVAEGVIFNNLSLLMDTHVNRLVVLRPNITKEERTDALISIFKFLGAMYDFGFNFADNSSVVCTEVQYHAFSGKGDISFELTKRAGNPTLSADDIVNYYLKKKGSFDFVLLALEDSASTSHMAKIYKGEDGKNALTSLMKAETK